LNNTLDEYLDIKSLSAFSKIGCSTIRYHIRENGLPCFQIPGKKGKAGKILIKRNEFHKWMERYRMNVSVDLDAIASDVMDTLR
jgi:hypothetical protein